MARHQQGTRLSVFTGREATLNRAILHALTRTGPLTIYDIHKHVKTNRGLKYTKYASVNKRVRDLAGSGYIRKIGARKTKAGFEAGLYELTARSYLAMLLSPIDLEKLLKSMDESATYTVLGGLVQNGEAHL